jgi:uracil-DNA glycosylase family 4
MSRLTALHDTLTACRKCPRLVAHREETARVKVRRFLDWDYWGKPVPGLGDAKARLLIVGLAPAAHGGNRTGRIFTGDRSGDWLYRALHAVGFASQPHSVSRDDGMRLIDCYITATVRCAPPGNKPLPEEFDRCRPFLVEELRLLRRVRVVVALGRIAFEGYLKACRELGHTLPRPLPAFGHGRVHRLPWGVTLIGSYHPSQQNTFTGKLTKRMFESIFATARKALARARSGPLEPGDARRRIGGR